MQRLKLNLIDIFLSINHTKNLLIFDMKIQSPAVYDFVIDVHVLPAPLFNPHLSVLYVKSVNNPLLIHE